MGFNKRFLDKEGIMINIDELDRYFKSDAFIFMDDFSYKVFNFYGNGKTKNEVINFIKSIS